MLTKDLDGILIVRWQVPACVVLHKADGKIARNEFETKREALQFCSQAGIEIQEIIGKGWNQKNGALSSL